MVHSRRFVNRRSPNLQQEMLQDAAAVSAGGVGLTNLLLEIAKEVGDVILRLIILDYAGSATSGVAPDMCECALISKPISEGVPTAGDFDDPRYVVSSYSGAVRQTDVLFGYHWRQNLSIKVPAGNNVYASVLNRTGIQCQVTYRIRLFWQSL